MSRRARHGPGCLHRRQSPGIHAALAAHPRRTDPVGASERNARAILKLYS